MIDAGNGRIIHEKDAYEERPVAHLQDLMTALLVAEHGDQDGKVTITEADTQVTGEKLGLTAGAAHSRRELVKALMLRPANDAAHALAVDHSGSVEAFVKAMNERGEALGLANTSFTLPYGADADGQKSTARDVALLAWECYFNELLRECAATNSFSLGATPVTNQNDLMREQSYCNGLKHGKSEEAKVCLASSGEKDGRHRIVVVLRSTDTWVFRDSKVLMEWALRYD